MEVPIIAASTTKLINTLLLSNLFILLVDCMTLISNGLSTPVNSLYKMVISTTDNGTPIAAKADKAKKKIEITTIIFVSTDMGNIIINKENVITVIAKTNNVTSILIITE